jgi:predicted hydrocarbon binding protein
LAQPRQGRDVYQVHVHATEPHANGPTTDLLRLLSTVGERARVAGLDGDLLARRMGRALGEAMGLQAAMPKPERREALDHVGQMLGRCGLGQLRIVSVTPLLLRVDAAAGGYAGAYQGRRCAHVAGFLEGTLGALLGKPPEVRELDCVGLGNPYCTFSCDL